MRLFLANGEEMDVGVGKEALSGGHQAGEIVSTPLASHANSMPSSEAIEHQVDQHSRDRNVHPDRKRVFRDEDVLREASLESEERGSQHHGQDDNSKHRVCQQQWEVHIADPAFFGETHRANVVVVDRRQLEFQEEQTLATAAAKAGMSGVLGTHPEFGSHSTCFCYVCMPPVEA